MLFSSVLFSTSNDEVASAWGHHFELFGPFTHRGGVQDLELVSKMMMIIIISSSMMMILIITIIILMMVMMMIMMHSLTTGNLFSYPD